MCGVYSARIRQLPRSKAGANQENAATAITKAMPPPHPRVSPSECLHMNRGGWRRPDQTGSTCSHPDRSSFAVCFVLGSITQFHFFFPLLVLRWVRPFFFSASRSASLSSSLMALSRSRIFCSSSLAALTLAISAARFDFSSATCLCLAASLSDSTRFFSSWMCWCSQCDSWRMVSAQPSVMASASSRITSISTLTSSMHDWKFAHEVGEIIEFW
mmetsp:Transcript_5784/g.13375  ORF Transcript_5784/g.13375 Transcript_5784/m.13375 type:complete len:215 (-) Transcript_5784:925-1569(-)